jgi:hypothetical protein
MARIRRVAGTVVAARLTTIIETGNVDHAGLSDSPAPIMPPSVTMTIDPVAEMSWQVVNRNRLRTAIDSSRR